MPNCWHEKPKRLAINSLLVREHTNQIQRGTNESTHLTQRDNSQEKQRLQQQYMKTCSCVNNVWYIQQRVGYCCKQHSKDGFNKSLDDGPDATSFSRKGSLASCKHRRKGKHATDSLLILSISKNQQKQSLPENITLIYHAQPTP